MYHLPRRRSRRNSRNFRGIARPLASVYHRLWLDADHLADVGSQWQRGLPAAGPHVEHDLAGEVEPLAQDPQVARRVGKRGEGVIHLGIIAVETAPIVLDGFWHRLRSLCVPIHAALSCGKPFTLAPAP